jgi:cysteine desulfurase/selenocysteine lyase
MIAQEAAEITTLVTQEFPVTQQFTYLDAASRGPWPNRTRAAVAQFAEEAQFPFANRVDDSAIPPPTAAIARAGLARLIGAAEEDLVWTANTSHGLNIAAQGIDWRPGDNVVVPVDDYPSLSFAFFNLEARGVDVRFVRFTGVGPSVDDLMAATDSRTRAVACSSIRWDSGWRMDLVSLGERCAQRGCLLILDGTQLVGARRLDVRAAKISAIAVHGYKWLMAGQGIAALYVAPEAVEQIRPTFAGSGGYDGPIETFDPTRAWKRGAGRYATGGNNPTGFAALASSLSLIEEVGIDRIEESNDALAERLHAGLVGTAGMRMLSTADPTHRSAIVFFTTGARERDVALVRALHAERIIVALRPNGLRVSPHFYNTEADIDRFVERVAALSGA